MAPISSHGVGYRRTDFEKTKSSGGQYSNMPPPPNIYIIGAQSTGKTTLVNALAAFFREYKSNTIDDPQSQPCILKEVARGVLSQHKLTANDITLSQSSALRVQRLILEAQVKVEAETRHRNQWYISDRSALDPLAYAELYSGSDGMTELYGGATWKTAAKWMEQGVVILCEAGGEWLVDDGVRLMPRDKQAWLEMHQTFCEILDKMDMEHYILPSSISKIETRVEFVVEQWNKKRDLLSRS